MKKGKIKLDLVSVLPILIGIGLIVLSGVYLAKSKIPFTNTVYVDGTISKIVDNNVYVKYEAGGLVRQKILSTTEKQFYEHQEIRIYYNKKNPDKVFIDNSKNTARKISKTGIWIIFFGIIFLIIRLLIKNTKSNLKKSGKRIAATIKELKVNKNITRNGKNPYIVVCTWTNPEDNKTYTFNSPKIWGNPGELISLKNITTLIVYANKKDYSKYIVDIDPLK